MSRYKNIITSNDSPDLEAIIQKTKATDFEQDQKTYGSIDPRVDKLADHRYWEDILWNAWHTQRDMYYVLHAIRCGGSELTLTPGSFKLLQGEWSDRGWEDVKQNNLSQLKDRLITLLMMSRAGRVIEEELPEGLFGSPPKVIEGNISEQKGLF